MFNDFICHLKYANVLAFMDFETAIFFCTKHPVDHYILKWQPPPPHLCL